MKLGKLETRELIDDSAMNDLQDFCKSSFILLVK